MKNLLLFSVITFVSIINFRGSFAQNAPQKFNYQAVARDADGSPMADQELALRIAIVSGTDMERPVYAEEHTVTTNKLGLFNLQIGGGEVIEGEFNTIDWGSASHYLSSWMDVDNSGRFQELGTSQLLSVPYALYAARSGTSHFEEGETRSDPNDWTMNGNAGTDDATNFIGTTDAQDLVLKADNAEVARFTTDSALQMTSGGRILFGTYNAVNMDGERNIHIGERAGEVSSGNQNAFIGYNAGQVNTTGEKNTFIGPTAGRVNTTGNQNAFIGGRAGFNNTSGSQNAFIGWQAGRDNTTGTQNTFIGKYAGLSNTTGSSNTYIGKDADGSPTLSNATAIGAGATVTQSNSVVLGSGANVGVGTSAPSAKLHVEGSLKLADGNQADGYVLTSDSLGNASWVSPSALSVDTFNIISDADGDTRILVEESTDEDHIRFYTSDTEIMTVANNGDVNIGRSTSTYTTGIIENYESGAANSDESCGTSCYGDYAWQSFTMEANETVEYIQLYFEGSASNINSVTLDFVLYEGEGTGGTVVYQANGITLSGFQSNDWVTIDVPDFVASDGQYTIYISEALHWAYNFDNGYLGGESGLVNPDLDFFFRVYGLGYNDNYVKVTGNGLEVGDYILPYADGTSGQVLSTDGSGAVSWQDAAVDTDDQTLSLSGTDLSIEDGNTVDLSSIVPTVVSVFDTLGGVVLPGSAVDETSDDFVFGSTQLDDDGDSDHDNRFFFDKSKGAFRVGLAPGNSWNASNRGDYSFASGSSTMASGQSSTAMGSSTTASGLYSIATGYSTWASGQSSVAMGDNSDALANYAMAMGQSCSATAQNSIAIGTSAAASGTYSMAFGREVAATSSNSIALGQQASATGASSIAIGYGPGADGSRSVAIGENSTASGDNSMALGTEAQASGSYALSIGNYATAKSGYETALGRYNTNYTPNSTTGWNTADRLFSIGNGTGSSNKSDAMVVLKSGEIGIGTSSPDTTLHVVGQIKYDDGNQAAGYVLTSDANGNASWTAASSLAVTTVFDTLSGVVIPGSAVDETSDDFVFGSTQLDDDGISSHDKRFFFDKGNAAFRAGRVTNANWDADSLGLNSFASGFDTKATGNNSTAMGETTVASGEKSTAIGHGNIASGSRSTAFGEYTSATEYASTALGYQTTASGLSSTAIGNNTTAPSGYETSIGAYNTSYTPNSATGWNSADRLFTIGNGTNDSSRSDAMVVLKNGNVGIGTASPTNLLTVYSTVGGDGDGITIANPRPVLILEDTDANTWKIEMNAKDLQFTEDGVGTAMTIEEVTGEVGIGTTTPGYKLEVNGTAAKTGGGSWTATSDRRLKQNINEYSDGLEALMQIRPVTYHYNEKSGYDTEPEYVGVIAQELQEVAPYMVGNFEKDGVEYLNVDNSAMTYMLINAVKELKAENDALKTNNSISTERVRQLEDENASLKAKNEANTARLDRIEALLQLDTKTQR